jgi:hypothetical protein
VPDERDARRPNIATLVLAILGASAGLTFFLYVVGALLEFRRLQTLHFAAQDVVPALPQNTMLVLAAHALLVPIALGAVAGVVLALLRTPQMHGLMLIATAAIVVACVVLFPFLGWRDRGAVAGAALAGVAGWAAAARRGWSAWHAATIVFGAAMLLGTSVAFVNAWLPPVHLACAQLALADGSVVQGFYVGASSDEFFVAPGRGRRSVRRLYVLPRSKVERLSLYGTVAVRDGGPKAPGSVKCL